MYGLSVHQRTPDKQLLDAARSLIQRELRHEKDLQQLGFVIVHEARPANFVLIHTWQGVDLRQRYFTSSLDQPLEIKPFVQGTIGCVWELGIVQHERNAWIHTMLKSGSSVDYLRDTLIGQV